MSTRSRLFSPLLAIAVCTIGCGSSDEAGELRVDAYSAIDEGNKAFENRDYAAAVDNFRRAIDNGSLNPDAYSSAAVKLAVSYGALGKFDDASLLLDELEAGAPNRGEVYAARSYVLAKQGKAAEARAALAQARRYNRTVQEFKD